MNLDFLKPSDAEIRRLAEEETAPTRAFSFEPICHGPIIAVLILGVAGTAAIPHFVLRTLAQIFRSESSPSPKI